MGPHSNLGKKFGKILKIRKNTWENSEKYWKFGKILGKIRKNRKNSEKYFEKFGKIALEKSEKYFGKFGKILQKIRKNTLENSEKYFQKSGSRTQNHFFRICVGHSNQKLSQKID